MTSRWSVINSHIPQKFWDQDKPFILAFWHGRILMMPYCWDYRHKVNMLISQHRDGQLIAQTIAHLGVETVRGSSNNGGASALRSMLKSLKNGTSIGITPDGPRGPRLHLSSGVVNMARMSGVPIIPCAYGTSSRKHLRSWDRFCVALPFSKGVIVWGNPIEVPRKSSPEELASLQLTIENSLTDVTNEADRLTGHALIESDGLSEKSL